jgi:hypothetical protein
MARSFNSVSDWRGVITDPDDARRIGSGITPSDALASSPTNWSARRDLLGPVYTNATMPSSASPSSRTVPTPWKTGSAGGSVPRDVGVHAASRQADGPRIQAFPRDLRGGPHELAHSLEGGASHHQQRRAEDREGPADGAGPLPAKSSPRKEPAPRHLPCGGARSKSPEAAEARGSNRIRHSS